MAESNRLYLHFSYNAHMKSSLRL